MGKGCRASSPSCRHRLRNYRNWGIWGRRSFRTVRISPLGARFRDVLSARSGVAPHTIYPEIAIVPAPSRPRPCDPVAEGDPA